MSMGAQSVATRKTATTRKLRAILENELQEAAEAIAQRHVELGRRIKKARDDRGWKQKQLAAEVHVEPGTVSRWERGAHAPDMSTIYRIAQALERPVLYFVAGLDMESPESALSAFDQFEHRLAANEAAVERVRLLMIRGFEAIDDDAALHELLAEARQPQADQSQDGP